VAAAAHRPAQAGENGGGDTPWVVTTQTTPWRAALGARCLEAVSWTGYDDVLAFRNPDGATILIAHNPLGEAMPIKIAVGQRQLQAVLPPDSFSTLRVAT
jgi:hypothetical protein